MNVLRTEAAPIERRREDLQSGRRLEYFTIGWNVLESVASVWAGLIAGSTSLVGFGVDAAIESVSGIALLWRLHDAAHESSREVTALKIVGTSFVMLAAWVAYEAVESLILREPSLSSPIGIAIASLSLVVMPWLARRKRQVAARIQSRALESDSRQTALCAYLSAILLGGLLLNSVLGWWWADAVAALAMVPIIASEGFQALRGEQCETCSPA